MRIPSQRCAWSEHLRALQPALERHALRLCRDRDEARDLVQDTFERAWRRHAAFAMEPPPRAWLFKVLRNLFFDRCKRRSRTAEVSVPAPDLAIEPPAEPPATPEDAVEALARLPGWLRDVVEAHDLQGLRYREIAARLAIPMGTVGTRLSRARARLRRMLDPEKRRGGRPAVTAGVPRNANATPAPEHQRQIQRT